MKRAQLIAAGFHPATYEGQDGEFLTKRAKVSAMPRARELVDDDLICGDMEAVTEVCPDGAIYLSILDADYLEGPMRLDSEVGQALLGDAVAAQ